MTEEYPSSLECLFTGLNTAVGPFDAELKKPIWYDDRKAKLGQQFAMKHFASIEYAQMLSLMILFSFGGNTKPLLFTGKSHTVEAASKRYLSTALRVLSWYQEDLWKEHSAATANFLHVRFLHQSVSEAMNRIGKPNIGDSTNLHFMLDESEIHSRCVPYLQKDFHGSCPSYVQMTGSSPIFINQAEMSFTLFGFMGLVTLYPEFLGIHGASPDEFEGFVHLWRVIGYKLGVLDRFNFCAGSLVEVRDRCHDVINLLFIPNLVLLNEEWEHLSRCMIEGIRLTLRGPRFETSLLYLFWLIGVKTPTFSKHVVTYRNYMAFQISKFVFYILMRIPLFKRRCNYFVENMLKGSSINEL